MCLRADAADPIRDQRHLFNRTSDDESFEAAQLRDLEIRIGYVSLIVEEDLDFAVTFKTGYGINTNSLGHDCSFTHAGFAAFSNDPAKLKR